MSHDRERERGGDDGYDNVQQNYYQRSWGDHPDLRSLDGRSQASEGQGETSHIAFCSVLFCSLYTLLHTAQLQSLCDYCIRVCVSSVVHALQVTLFLTLHALTVNSQATETEEVEEVRGASEEGTEPTLATTPVTQTERGRGRETGSTRTSLETTAPPSPSPSEFSCLCSVSSLCVCVCVRVCVCPACAGYC